MSFFPAFASYRPLAAFLLRWRYYIFQDEIPRVPCIPIINAIIVTKPGQISIHFQDDISIYFLDDVPFVILGTNAIDAFSLKLCSVRLSLVFSTALAFLGIQKRTYSETAIAWRR